MCTPCAQALGAERIETRPPGYRLRVEPDELDVERFHAPVAAWRRRRADRGAVALARSGARQTSPTRRSREPDAARLDDARLAALEARIDADLEAGRHDVADGRARRARRGRIRTASASTRSA